MKFLIKLNHPAHYHLFKNLINKFRENNHEVLLVIKSKDILKELLEKSNEKYIELFKPLYRKKNKLYIIFVNFYELIKQDVLLKKIIKNIKPNALIGTDTSIAHLGWLYRIPTFILNEDDFTINKLFCITTYPFAKYIISPEVCDVGPFYKKKISYNGYQKLAYLHPEYFKPDYEVAKKYLNFEKKNFLIRLVNFTAGHDIEANHKGISKNILTKLVDILSKYGNVFISSEIKLDSDLIKYKLNINPLDIHHVLAYIDLFISDSQSMTIESSLLGTPSIRFNSFVGKISVLNELEKKYELTYGISSENQELLFKKVEELLQDEYLKQKFIKKQQKMLSEKINLTDFLFNTIINKTKK